jgi:hypothetical protein
MLKRIMDKKTTPQEKLFGVDTQLSLKLGGAWGHIHKVEEKNLSVSFTPVTEIDN